MRKLGSATAIAMALALSGCFAGSNANRGLESVHQPIVTQQNFVFDANASDGSLSPSELARVSGWLDAMNVRYGDRVSVDTSSAYGSSAAVEAIGELMSRKGMMLAQTVPMTPGAIQPGYLRIVITRATASVPGCPNWNTRSAMDFNATTTSNYGCATNSNIAAMVADPMDLVHGQSERSNDPLTASRAIRSYRAAPPTGANGLRSSGGAGGAPAAPAMPGGGGQ